MEARKDRKEREKLSNAEKGVVGDVDFVRMISAWREANRDQAKKHDTFSTNEAEKNAGGAICICVRKRPISRREVSNKDHDAVSCVHPSVVVHDCRLRVDGISKYLNNHVRGLEQIKGNRKTLYSIKHNQYNQISQLAH